MRVGVRCRLDIVPTYTCTGITVNRQQPTRSITTTTRAAGKVAMPYVGHLHDLHSSNPSDYVVRFTVLVLGGVGRGFGRAELDM